MEGANVRKPEGSPPKSARRYKNPFIVPKGADRVSYRGEPGQPPLAQRLTLAHRAELPKYSIPSLVDKSPIPVPPPEICEPKPVPAESPHDARRVPLSDFINQRREVFFVQLMINRKRGEQQRLEAEIRAEEQQLHENEGLLSETSNQFTMTSAQGEAALKRANKASDAALKKRKELQQEFHLAINDLQLIRSEISKRREKLAVYRSYREFLESISPAHAPVEELFKHPSALMDEMDLLERRNLFLLSHYQTLFEQSDAGVSVVKKDLVEAESNLSRLEGKASMVPVVEPIQYKLREGNLKEAQEIENELQELEVGITRTYVHCFGPGQSVASLTMLERIENALEALFMRIQLVNPTYLHTKQKKQDEIRLEQHRLDMQAKKDAEQKLKYDQAVERAQMPIKRRTGRPCLERTLPLIINREDPELARAAQRERERLETLLYGEESEEQV
jgi:hypothetical protein